MYRDAEIVPERFSDVGKTFGIDLQILVAQLAVVGMRIFEVGIVIIVSRVTNPHKISLHGANPKTMVLNDFRPFAAGCRVQKIVWMGGPVRTHSAAVLAS